MTSTATVLTIIIAVIIVVAIAAWIFIRQRRSHKLRSRFGPEYNHAVVMYGSSAKAEQELLLREKRMKNILIHPLPPEARDRYMRQWHDVESRFVDDPTGSAARADQLVIEVMRAQGYPIADFEKRAADLSVDHSDVVRNYRAAHAIALKRDRGEATTEDLRQAVVHYRNLFDDLLEAHVAVKER
jgi:hypothetical protein